MTHVRQQKYTQSTQINLQKYSNSTPVTMTLLPFSPNSTLMGRVSLLSSHAVSHPPITSGGREAPTMRSNPALGPYSTTF